MLEILTVLMALVIAYLVNVNRRLKAIEEQMASWLPPVATDQADWLATPLPATEAGPVVADTPSPVTEAEGVPEPSPDPVILYAERRPEVSEPAEWEEPGQEEGPGRGFSFEDLFGRRLPIWAGGITLAIAGVLIVKLSIEAGLLSPSVRVISGALFGLLLIGGAELALRKQDRVGDVRVRQSLAGAGLASLYATILVAANLYQLIPPGAAMVGMALVTGLAMLLAVRFGAPSALLGLVGGLAAPALIGSPEPNIPLLSVYLALAVGGLTALSRNQRWAWLGISALLGGFGWGLALLIGGAIDAPGTISLGLYILLLGIALPALGLAGERRDQVQLIAGVVAAAQMAALVATGGFAMLNWGMFGLIAAALAWLAAREPKLAMLPPIALTVALLLLGAWPDPAMREFALVAAGIALLHGIMPLKRVWMERGGILDAGQIAAILLGGWLISMMQFYRDDGSIDSEFGLLALGLGAVAAAVAGLGWRVVGRQEDGRFAIVATAAAVLFAASANLLLPNWLAGPAIAAVGLALVHLGQVGADRRFEPVAWIFAGAGLFTTIYGSFFPEPAWKDATLWGLAALVSGLFAWRAGFRAGRIIAQFLAPVMVYGGLTELVDARFHSLIPPMLLIAGALAARALPSGRLMPAMIASGVMILLWALQPVGEWLTSGAASLMGDPMLVSGVPEIEASLTKLLLPALAGAIGLWLSWQRLEELEQRVGVMLAAVIGAVALHGLFKHIFAIGTEERFLALGMAERTVWELLLAAGGAIALRMKREWLGYALAGAGAGHLLFYSLLLHNPLWESQQVGPWPILNLLLPAYGLGFALLMLAERSPIAGFEGVGRAVSAARMGLIALFAFSTLRQLFHGELLVEPGLGQAEDIGRSLLAIALAVGFLLWGIRSRNRDWRIASLVLMIAAVGKVFLFDAAGLEGVTRIGSFVALGFSLIGIGWLYSRHLSGDAPQLAKAGSSR